MKKMKRYRIYTEDKNFCKIIDKFAETLPGFTVYFTIGFWKGEKEISLVIEILMEDDFTKHAELNILDLAQWIKGNNQQESVMITIEEIETVSV